MQLTKDAEDHPELVMEAFQRVLYAFQGYVREIKPVLEAAGMETPSARSIFLRDQFRYRDWSTDFEKWGLTF